jgi:hypothetical protein
LQHGSNIVVLLAAVITLITALVPLWKWVWRNHLVHHFDAKKEQYNELVEQAKWYEERAVKLEVLRGQLLYEKMNSREPDRFKLSEMISKLDRKDAEWARKVEGIPLLTEACNEKKNECLDNARSCRGFADDVERKVLFW